VAHERLAEPHRINLQIYVLHEMVELFELAPSRGAGRRMGDLAITAGHPAGAIA